MFAIEYPRHLCPIRISRFYPINTHAAVKEPQRYPSNQEQYSGQLIPSSLTRNNLVPPCENCKEFQEIRQDNHLCVKSCIHCFKEYANCFCNQVCNKVIPGGISKYNYKYIVCNNEECEFIGVRCTTCLCLCKIFVSKEGNLFWGCNSNEYLADESPGIVGVIKNEILSPTTPNHFISQNSINDIMNFQNISPTPNELGMSSSIEIIELKCKFEAELQNNFNEIRKDFDELKNELKSQTNKNFNNLKDKLTSQNEKNFSNLEEKLIIQTESSISLFNKEFLEFKEQNQKNNDQIQDNFSILFKKLKIENLNDDGLTSKVTR
ncbi:hypothetical protein GLOIN_2v1790329 [Rhizophagus clarus]|uniref:Uncharacterized protein n=2 Tax=Rhizophagus clarus TaxID=94130 RepID=A0A8H3L6A6_9GLOM|nr:hypothetical protein GLOIN_2v1790329 [Rhizophagus clarus]